MRANTSTPLAPLTRLLCIAAAMLCFSLARASDDGGFLFVTFRGEGTAGGEQIYFGLSRDGKHWQALNGGKPALTSALGEKGARDPYVLRAADGDNGGGGKFYLIATDLSIYRNHDWKRAVQSGSRAILVWESSDLVNWSAPRLVNVAPPDAGCAWAPEAIYDPEKQSYLVYWASTTKGDDYAKHRIWAAWTKDFRAFSEPFVYIEKPTTIIDTDIVRDGADGRYYRFTKDEKYKAITMETADSLTGEWRDVPGFTLAQARGYEGPACFLLTPARDGKAAAPGAWYLLLDAYSAHTGYKPFVTGNLASGNFTPAPAADFEFPFRFRHGGVLRITSAEYERLKARMGDGGGLE